MNFQLANAMEAIYSGIQVSSLKIIKNINIH